jgi:rhodanese-related sulfurtransferase
MKKSHALALLSSLSLLTTSAVLAKEASHQPKIQDSKKAVEFFEQELSFKTNPHGVKAVLDGTVKNVTIVDVRSAADYAKGHIPGAVNVPWEKHDSFDGPDLVFPELRKDGFNYVYCYTGLCNLSQKAAKKFASLGYPVKEIVGGYEEWVAEKNPVEK